MSDEVGGESTAYWEREWSVVSRRSGLDALTSNPTPVVRLLESYAPTSGTIAELGSGAALNLAALAAPGRHLIGIDLAQEASRLNASTWPDMSFVDGDVRCLPLADQALDCVISLGVVEHIEAGPHEALAEHARVLRRGGVGLLSVPMVSAVSWLKDRWFLDIRRTGSYSARGRLVTNVDEPAVADGPGPFHQYEFTPRQWRALLADVGLTTTAMHRHDVSAGIGELPLPGRSQPTSTSGTNGSSVAGSPAAGSPTSTTRRRGDGLRRIVLSERPKNVPERALSAASQYALGHMVMAVVRRT